MKNFKKLSRKELKNVFGGLSNPLEFLTADDNNGGKCGGSCTLYIQDPVTGQWKPNYGSCSYVQGNTNAGTGYPQGSCQCNIGSGQTYQLQSNGGVSRCEN